MSVKWQNVPVPEAHVGGIVLGMALHLLGPRRLFRPARLRGLAGWFLILSGVGLAAWAVVESGETDVSTPDELLTGGPYAFSRHPMYIGWSLIYLGMSLVSNARWILALFPLVVLYNHLVDVRSEERLLEQKFGEEYRAYRRRVRRYI